MKIKPKPKQFFIDRVKISPSGCWLWTRSMSKPGKHGRGVYRDGCRTVKAHRGVYITWYGPIPDGKCVMHICDTPKCCNPDHLRLGTHAEKEDE